MPGIARWPGRIKAGAVSGHPWAFWDFLPTACEAAGVQPPENIDGVSFLPEMLGGKQGARGFLYWEFHEGGGSSQAVRMGKWKGLRKSPTGPLELYDLTADVGEEKNVAADHADVVRKIETYLAGARTESSHWPLRERRKPPPKRKSPPKQT